MPRRFLEVCRRKSDYLGQLNRNLGRATMNLTWKNRFLESRAAVMTQFEELAGILEEFSGQMEQALDVTMTWEGELKTALRKRRIDVESLLVLQYGQGRREVFMTARMTNGRCMTARDASEAIARVMKGSFSAAGTGRPSSPGIRPPSGSLRTAGTGSCSGPPGSPGTARRSPATATPLRAAFRARPS